MWKLTFQFDLNDQKDEMCYGMAYTNAQTAVLWAVYARNASNI